MTGRNPEWAMRQSGWTGGGSRRRQTVIGSRLRRATRRKGRKLSHSGSLRDTAW
jgi:hypothetical protein